MGQTKDEIIHDIEEFVKKHGGTYEEYYIGITNNLKRRIVEDKEVYYLGEHINTGRYIKDSPRFEAEASSNQDAVDIEVYFQLEKGMQGYKKGSRGNKETTRFVYCFKQNPNYELLKEVVDNVVEKVLQETRINKIKRFEDFNP